MPVVLAPIAVLVLVLWVIAAALAISVIMAKVGDIFRAVPVVGGYIAGAVESLAHGIANVCGKLEHGIDGLIGASWHWMARYLDRTWHHMVADAHLGFQLAEKLAGLAYSHLGIKAALHSIAGTFRSLWHDVRRLEKWALRMEARIKRIEHDLGRGIGEDVLPRIKTLERDVIRIERKEIPAAEALARTAEADVSQLGKWIAGSFPIPKDLTIAGVVAIALGSLGLGGLRCSNFTKLLGKYACGLGTLLDDLLGLAIAGLALEAVCEFLPLIEAAFGAIIGPMVHLLTEVPLGDCEHEPADWSLLHVQAGPLPPAQTLGTFPT
jgi:hypothetical protein